MAINIHIHHHQPPEHGCDRELNRTVESMRKGLCRLTYEVAELKKLILGITEDTTGSLKQAIMAKLNAMLEDLKQTV